MIWRSLLIALAALVAALEPPSQDPFYVPPSGYAKKAPGTILRSRQISNIQQSTFPGIPINISATYQFLFRSTDVYGKATAGVNTVMVPSYNANSSRVLSYQFPYDTPDKDCEPSYTLQEGFVSSPVNLAPSPLLLLIISALNRGWYISIPDHEGLNASLGVGLVNGQTVLDSLRAAVLSTNTTGISPQAELVIWGYSGGAFASAYASELQSTYAPELNIVGSAVGGISPNSTNSIAANVKAKHSTGLIIGQLLGLANSYTNMSTYLNNQLVASTAARFRLGLSNCSAAHYFGGLTVGEFFKHPSTATTAAVPASLAIWSSGLGLRGIAAAPLYIFQAVHDGLTAISDVDTYVARICTAGALVTYLRDASNIHVSEGVVGEAGSYQWLIDRFDGISLDPACNTTDVDVTMFSPEAEDLFGPQVFSALQSAYVSAGGTAISTTTTAAGEGAGTSATASAGTNATGSTTSSAPTSTITGMRG